MSDKLLGSSDLNLGVYTAKRLEDEATNDFVEHSSSLQFCDVRPHRLAQRIEVVATFHAGNDPARAGSVGPFLHYSGHLYKIFVAEKQLSQWIALMCVKARRDD